MRLFLASATIAATMVQPTPPITVYVGAPVRDGFVDTDKGLTDSIADIRSRLSKLKGVRVSPVREGAHVVLTVTARGIGTHAYGDRINIGESYAGVDITQRPILANTYWLSSVLQVRDYKKEFLGAYTHELAYSMGAWGDCATQITRSIEAWINANRAQIVGQ